MLTEIYIEALLVDEELADQVWGVWYSGEIDILRACIAWLRVVTRVQTTCSTWVRPSSFAAQF